MISEVKSWKDLYLIIMCRIGRTVMKMCGEDLWRKQHKGILFCIELVDIYSHPECCLSR